MFGRGLRELSYSRSEPRWQLFMFLSTLLSQLSQKRCHQLSLFSFNFFSEIFRGFKRFENGIRSCYNSDEELAGEHSMIFLRAFRHHKLYIFTPGMKMKSQKKVKTRQFCPRRSDNWRASWRQAVDLGFLLTWTVQTLIFFAGPENFPSLRLNFG